MTNRPAMSRERRDLLAQVERELCACCRPALWRVAHRFVGQRVRMRFRDIVEPDHLALAVSLLDAGMSRPDARVAIMERLQVRRTKAYCLLRAALDARRDRVLPAMRTETAGLRQLALVLDDDE